ncbi:hypothetical protein N7492_010329 [Penicillium capsulatum]|uniref:Uncharacterized protein n=1 Tax=Penicillium capsulatum TaxID=69766 RepID=A0A9W9LEU3_9EURO|nr:hypothetical protein N7492_010329 [Penicillium capsulatum]KAJ6112834.1 hypothetical protein N7512_008158 [Penicillium capsulatum]
MATNNLAKSLKGLSLVLFGLALVALAVWGLLFGQIPSSGFSAPLASRIKPREVYNSTQTLSAEFRDAGMISSTSPEFATLNMTISGVGALEGEFCESHKGCDLAFICVDHKCVKGCLKRNDCSRWQRCKDGKCHFRRRECSEYGRPCSFHEQCCSGYCGSSGDYWRPWPVVCKRFYYPKPKPGTPKKPKKGKKVKKPKSKTPEQGGGEDDHEGDQEGQNIVEDVEDMEMEGDVETAE